MAQAAPKPLNAPKPPHTGEPLFCYPVAGKVGPANLGTEYRIDTFFAASGAGYAHIKDRLGRYVVHTGIDVNRGFGNSDLGLPLFATRAGTVVRVGFDKFGFGNYVVIKHDQDSAVTVWGERFGHMNKVLVKEGQRVGWGQQIGELGMTGNSPTAHLHFDYFELDPLTLRGGYTNWPGANPAGVQAAYTDPLAAWSRFGVITPAEARAK